MTGKIVAPEWVPYSTADPDFEMEMDVRAHPDSIDLQKFRHRRRAYTGWIQPEWKRGRAP